MNFPNINFASLFPHAVSDSGPADVALNLIMTGELARRSHRQSDHSAENRSLLTLTRVLAETPESILQALADSALELCQASVAGISLVEVIGDRESVRWLASSGSRAPYVQLTLPRESSPCSVVFQSNAAVLMKDPARHFPSLSDLTPEIHELLLVPLQRRGAMLGTIWAISRNAEHLFDNEDVRLLNSLSQVAITALQTREIDSEARRTSDVATTILEKITDGFYAVDRNWKFTYMNPRAAQLLNCDAHAVRGKDLWQQYPNLVGTEFEEMFRRVAGSGVASSATAFYPSHERWYEVHTFPATDGIAIYFRDASESSLAAEQLQISEERRRMALDAAELGAWNIDPRTNTLSNDERFQIIFSGEVGAINYERAYSLIHPEDRDRVQKAVAAATRSENPAPYVQEYRVIHPHGAAVRWVLGKGRANFKGEGEERLLISFDGTVADITDRKRMEDELRRIAADSSEADHRKNEFLAMLAHELRNPLAPISNALEIVQLAPGNAEVVQQASAMMERHVRHMVRLIDDLLDISRISQGKIDLRLAPVELSAVIQRAIETSRSAIDSAQHQLTVLLPPQPIYLQGDSVRLAQVFSNLLNNSSKHSEPEGAILITATVRDADVSISVADTGLGIAAEMLPKVFEMFTQVDRSLERSQGGLGIGLSLVQTLVTLHGGTVEARSEGLGKGSEFIVRLPILVDQSNEIHEPCRTALTSPARRILIVDDNEDSALSLSLILKMNGHHTELAYDGVAAVAAAESFRPDVILLDIGLPKLNGYEAARQIRQQAWGQKMLLVALTGWGQDEDRLRSKEAGFDKHMIKPVDHLALTKFLADTAPLAAML